MSRDIAPGTRIRDYRIESVLGRGGQGVVYLAEHTHLGRKVAFKVLPGELARDPDFRRRFLREARLAALLEHPNILPVYDAGEEDGHLFLAVRFVTGSDLGALIRSEGPLAPERALALLGAAASALDAASANGLVHRDVKPGNILVERRADGREHAYISDFGLTKATLAAQDLAVSGPLTKSGYFVGTPEYAAPEQIESKDVDGRTDQYSLGCVLFHSLTGRLPYPRDSLGSTLVAHMIEPPPRVTDLRSDLPRGLDDVVARALAKRKEERFASCMEMVEAARASLGSIAAAIPAPPPPVAALRSAPARPDAPPAPGPAGSAPTEASGALAPTLPATPPRPAPPEPRPARRRATTPARPPLRRRGALLGVVAGLVAVAVLATFVLVVPALRGGCSEQTYPRGNATVSFALGAGASPTAARPPAEGVGLLAAAPASVLPQEAATTDRVVMEAVGTNSRADDCAFALTFTPDGASAAGSDATVFEVVGRVSGPGEATLEDVDVKAADEDLQYVGFSTPSDDCSIIIDRFDAGAISGSVECRDVANRSFGTSPGSFRARFAAEA